VTALFTLDVEYVDGSTAVVEADQREMVRFEREERISARDATAQMPMAFIWCIAYYGLQRAGQVDAKTTRDKWESTVVSVINRRNEEPVNPGSPEAIEGSPSSSPSRPGRASGRSASTGRRRT
jgi:hypothetical protein